MLSLPKSLGHIEIFLRQPANILSDAQNGECLVDWSVSKNMF